MVNRTSHRPPPAPQPSGMDEIRLHLSRREAQSVAAALAFLSSDELATFTALLRRVQEGFAGAGASSDAASSTRRDPECGYGEHAFSPRDPLTRLMMRADGVTEGDLRAMWQRVAMARGFASVP